MNNLVKKVMEKNVGINQGVRIAYKNKNKFLFKDFF